MSNTPLTELDYRTHYIAAYIPLEICTGDDCVAWARDMVEAGRDTAHILILAACEKPASHREIDAYLQKALYEIGYPTCDDRELRDRLCSYYVYQLTLGKMIRQILNEICHLTYTYNGRLSRFKLLSDSWNDLEWGGYFAQEYWPGATLANIESLIIQQAHLWLAENEEFLRLK